MQKFPQNSGILRVFQGHGHFDKVPLVRLVAAVIRIVLLLDEFDVLIGRVLYLFLARLLRQS